MRDTDAHSWVEAWFDDWGWVTFDPTPADTPARSQIAALERAPEAGTDRGDAASGERRLGAAHRRRPRPTCSAPQSGPAARGPAAADGGAVVVVVRAGACRWCSRCVAWAVLRWRRRSLRPGGGAGPRGRRARGGAAPRRPPGRGGTTLRQLEQRLGRTPEAAAYLRALAGRPLRAGRAAADAGRPPRAAPRAGERPRAAGAAARALGAAAVAGAERRAGAWSGGRRVGGGGPASVNGGIERGSEVAAAAGARVG